MFGWLKSYLRRVSKSVFERRKSRYAPPDSRRANLRLEWLEHREVPANNTWLGGAGGFSVAANWSLGAVPVAADTIIANGASSNDDLTFPDTIPQSWDGIQIVNYSGTVEFPVSVTFNNYTQASGSVVTSNHWVWVESTFSWTGGDIDATAAGLIILRGVANGQIGTDTSSLDCGATIYLQMDGVIPSTVVQHGTLNLLADTSGIKVSDDSEFEQKKQNANGAAPVITSGAGTFADRGFDLIDGGTLISWGGTVPSIQMITEGHITLKEGGLTVSGEVPLSPWAVTMVGQNSKLSIPNGETLKATSGVLMSHGRVLSTYTAGVAQTATIDGVFRMDDGLIQLGLGPPPGMAGYSTLSVKKMAKLYGGMFEPKLDAANNLNSDKIHTEKELDTTAGFTVSPQQRPPIIFADVLVSEDGFTANSVDPTNPNPLVYDMQRTGNAKKFSVKKP
jgi:hypothetical protein